MSLVAAVPSPLPSPSSTQSLPSSLPHKRLSLTQSPRPTKIRKMGAAALARTESLLVLPTQPTPKPTNTTILPYHRTLQYYKDQRDRRRAHLHRTIAAEPTTTTTATTATATLTIRIATTPQHHQHHQQPTKPIGRPTVRHILPAKPSASPSSPPRPTCTPPLRSTPLPCRTPHTLLASCAPLRQSSPLAPTRAARPGRPVFPRSKPEVNLHRKAIKACMQASPEGQKILRMGPRLALSIMSATRELERIVAAQSEREAEEIHDVVMLDATANEVTSPISPGSPLTKSWVIVPGDDWEMVDCAA